MNIKWASNDVLELPLAVISAHYTCPKTICENIQMPCLFLISFWLLVISLYSFPNTQSWDIQICLDLRNFIKKSSNTRNAMKYYLT